MTVKFSIVERGNPTKPTEAKKFYPSVQSSGRTTLRELAKEIGKISTVSTVDTLAVLEALLSVIPEELAKGNIVELGEFGSFWLRNEADGCEKASQVTSAGISNLLPRFLPGLEFKKVLAGVKYEKVKGPPAAAPEPV